MNTILATATKCTLDKFYDQPLGKSLFVGEKLQWDGVSYEQSGHMFFSDFKRELKYDVTPCIFPMNIWGLPFIYNTILLAENIKDYECAIFVHDDVAIQHPDMLSIIQQQFDAGYSVVGLAGAKSAKIGEPALWHLMAPREQLSGSVAHPYKDGVAMTSFGAAPERVLLLDGLFLAVKIKDILDKDILFDEQFTFHFYDLDFCLQCNKAGLKLTTSPIWVTHSSGGLSNLDDIEFQRQQKTFLHKWSR